MWQKSPRRSGGEAYQEQISGVERGIEYAVTPPGGTGKPVFFDGYDAKRSVLLDAKDWKNYPPESARFWKDNAHEEAVAQLKAANGAPIEWHFSGRKGYDAVNDLFHDEDVQGIRLVITPATQK
jgi:hypothetical protein